MSTTLKVAKVSPITFNVIVTATTLQEINDWKYELKKRYACIHRSDFISGSDAGGRFCYVRTIRFTLREDVDSQHLLALLTELKLRDIQ